MATLNGVNYSNTLGLLLKTNASTQLSISTSGVIEFNESYTFPTSDGSANTVLLTNGSGALSFSTIPNASLDNSSITINGTSVSLGGSINVGDITNVSAGNGLTGGGSTGSITLNVGAGTGISVASDSVALDYYGTDNFIDSASDSEGVAILPSDTIIYSDETDHNVKKGLVSDLPYSNNQGTVTSIAISGSDGIDVDSGSPITTSGTIYLGLSNIPNSSLNNPHITINGNLVSLGGSINVGDITEVTAGNGLTGGGSSGSVTLNVGAGTGLSVGADLIALDYLGTNNFIDSATDLEGTAIALTDTIIYHDEGDNNVKKGLVSDLPFTNTSGTVTSVAISGSDGIDVDSGSPITGSGTIALGLSNVPNSSLANSSFTVNAPSGSDPVVPLGGTLNFTSSDSSVTIAGNSTTDTIDLTVDNSVNTYVTGGTFTSGSLSLGLNDGSSAQDITGIWTNIPNSALSNSSITINGSAISLGGSINVGDITAVTAGNGLTGGGSTGSVTLNVGAGTGISVAADTVGLDTSNTRNVDHSSVSISAGSGLSGGGTIASNRTISLDYGGTNNFIDSATDLEGTPIALTDTIIYHDATDNNVKKGLVSDLPYSNTSGTVTSVAISGTDGIDVDSGSPITSSGTITLGLSNVPNSSLANSSITIAGSTISLGGAISGDSIIADVGAGEITNAQLENSSITINGSAISLGGSINVGDITNVSAGNGLTGGGSTGSVTLNVGAGTGISVEADTVGLDYLGTNNFIDSATNLEGTGIALGDTIIYHDATDNNVKKGFVSDLPFTNTTGTVTSVAISGSDGIDVDSGSPITGSGTIALGLSNVPNSSLANSSVTVTGGNGLTGGGSVSLGSSVTLNVGAGTLIDVDGSNVNVDLSELTTSTSNADGDFFVVVDSANAQKKLTKGNINNSGFNNDAGYITSAGNTNIYSSNGTLSGARTLSQNGNRLKFDSSSAESFDIVKTTAATGDNTPRVFIEADASYGSVLELESPDGGTDFIVSRNPGNDRLFTVDGEGNLSAISKSFDIPHPNPEKKEQGMRLKHGNLEGPEHGVYIRGRQLNDKEIELPEYWLDLVDPDSITVQLTSVGSHQNLYVKEIKDNVVYIGNGNLFSNKIDCYYFIQAERKDINKIEVEYTKK